MLKEEKSNVGSMQKEGAAEEKPLAGKVVLVTGGARGLGAAICETLFNAGAHVIASDIREELLEETTSHFQENGRRMRAMTMDVQDAEQIRSTLDAIVEEYGRLDVLINNAGTDKTLSVEEMPLEDFDRVLNVNLRGPFITSKYAFPIMRKQGGGHIINVASTAAKGAWPNASAYHASKWGLRGLSYALHVEGRPLGIKVTALVVGGMATPFLLDRFPDIDTSTLQDPHNVANTVQFLLQQPEETVIPEVMVIPMKETSWP